ncbi:MAG: Alanine-tRNA ligase, partial [Candidatus Nomurabacteria bacterium GW2011_GWB1_47_6]
VFEGDENAPKDTESAEIWQKVGIPDTRIYFMPATKNWWSAGDNGPCGPDTEMFYDLTPEGLGDMTKEEYLQADQEQKVVEIWNDVFMEYEKKDGKVIGKLKNKNVDTGAGLERLSMVLQKKDNIFETDLFQEVMEYIRKYSTAYNERSARIIADHVRTATFLLFDGVLIGNKDRGYILRRLITRAVLNGHQIGFEQQLEQVSRIFVEKYEGIYFNISDSASWHSSVFSFEEEEMRFKKNLVEGMKEFEKGTDPFVLATTYGFPIELTLELAQEKNRTIDLENFKKKMAEHQKLSQTASAGMFKGGLANHNEKTIRLHTAHHLLLAALQNVVGPQVKQRGSNITEERLRIDFLCDHKLTIDFLCDHKLTDEEKKKVEDWVNDKIKRGLDVVRREMPFGEAQKIGAEMEFGAKYADIVSVYFVEDGQGDVFSKEFCGGPHVKNTGELSIFKIQKEEAVSQGIRRIKAVLL